MAWVFTIARNFALMKFREKASGDVPLEQERAVVADESGVERALDRMVLRAALRILHDDECQIIMLYDVAGLKHREIAAFLQMPLPTVLSKYRRALSKLRKHVKEDL